MMGLVVILVWVAIGQVVPMVVGEVLMVALEVNLVVMEDMLVPWGHIEVILHLGMLVDMVEAMAEAMILVGMTLKRKVQSLIDAGWLKLEENRL